MTFPPYHILLVGCGKMGGALLKSWLNANDRTAPTPSLFAVTVVEPGGLGDIGANTDSVTVIPDIHAIPQSIAPHAVVFAVKPQIMEKVLPAYQTLPEHTLFLSIAAGKTLDFFARHVGEERPIVRAMPNLPASIGQGTTGAYANASVTAKQRVLAEQLLGVVGKLHWLPNESLLDAVTAISGSGPAYLFLLLEALEESGAALGLPPELAKALAYETMEGSIALAKKSSAKASTLREQVTSPNGTTAAALEVLMGEAGLKKLMR
ncbi:MAG: proC, partial [Rickettsiales bacterium]|nr:proC [Rickettsiales bacterium]